MASDLSKKKGCRQMLETFIINHLKIKIPFKSSTVKLFFTARLIVFFTPFNLFQKFTVGCYCAERGHIYHDLHHHDVRLKEECIEKVTSISGKLIHYASPITLSTDSVFNV